MKNSGKFSRNFIRKLICLLVAVIICSVSVTTVYAATNDSKDKKKKKTKYEIIIMDEENLLTSSEEKKLKEDMRELVEYGNVIFLTTNLKDKNFEKNAEKTYYKLCKNEPGVIFQIDMGNRKLTLSSSGEMDDLIAHERDTIVDNIYRYATDEKYYECAKECFHEIYLVINDGEIAHTMKYIDNAIYALILGLIINFVVVFITTRKKNAKSKVFGEMDHVSVFNGVAVTEGKVSRRYSPITSESSGGGHSSGGRHSSGGGGGHSSGGGGFSGGSSSHGF